MRYHLHIEEEKKKKQDSEKNLEKLHLTNQINNINEDFDNLEMTVESLNEQFIQLAKKAEEKNQMQYFVNGNAMITSAEEKAKKLETLVGRKEELLAQNQKLS